MSLLLNFVYILFIKRRGKLATFSLAASVLETNGSHLTANSLPLLLSSYLYLYLILIKFPQLCHNLFEFRDRTLHGLRAAVGAFSLPECGSACSARVQPVINCQANTLAGVARNDCDVRILDG